MRGGGPQTQHVSFTAKHRQGVQTALHGPGGAAFIAVAGAQIPPGIAFRQVYRGLRAFVQNRRNQQRRAQQVLRLVLVRLGILREAQYHGTLHRQAGTGRIFNHAQHVGNQAIPQIQPLARNGFMGVSQR